MTTQRGHARNAAGHIRPLAWPRTLLPALRRNKRCGGNVLLFEAWRTGVPDAAIVRAKFAGEERVMTKKYSERLPLVPAIDGRQSGSAGTMRLARGRWG